MFSFNTGIAIITTATFIALFIFVAQNPRIEKKEKNKFYIVYAVALIATLADFIATHLNGSAMNTRMVHSVVKCMDYMFTPAVIVFYTQQFSSSKKLHRVLYGVLTLNAILQLASLATNWTYYIDDNNIYRNGPLHMVYNIIYILCIIIMFVCLLKYGRKHSKTNLASIIAILVFTAFGIILQEINSDIRTSSLVLAMAAAFLYIQYNEFKQQESDENIRLQKRIIERDPLTGLMSRHSYNDMILDYKKSGVLEKNLVIFSVDLNGLKVTNDTLGHDAGDVFLKNAARCLEETIGEYGECYRIGGDEFIARLFIEDDEIQKVKRKLEEEAANRNVNFAIGTAAISENRSFSIERLVSIADKRMYQNKDEYYRSSERDALTNLYTKDAFYYYGQTMLDQSDQEYLICVADIENFKLINERYGRDVGDAVLKYITRNKPKEDAGNIICGRIGADQFAWIRPYKEIDAGRVKLIVKNLMENAPIPDLLVKYGTYNTKINRSISIQQMCNRAIMAINSIKGDYGRIYAEYDDEMRNKLVFEQRIVGSMNQALAGKQFKVYYQPKYDVATGEVCGSEALVRWQHPELGFLYPGSFIPVFEKNGFIMNLDHYMFNAVCRQIKKWLEMGYEVKPVSINVSRRDFEIPNLVEQILDVLDQHSVPHELIHVEITESAYVDNPEVMKKVLGALHESGIKIELDDFGSGYSSLSALNDVEMDILKLDISMIQNKDKKSGKDILEFIMKLANILGVKTVQEGVETPEQLERVKALGCDYAQGFYFARPVSSEEFEAFLTRKKY